MNKIYLLFSGVVVIILIIIIGVALLIFGHKNPSSNPQVSPSPIPRINGQSDLVITKIDPADKSTSVPLDSKITIYFNRTPQISEVHLSILPSTYYSTAVVGNTLIITPNTPLTASTNYSMVIRTGTSELPTMKAVVFTTLGPTPTPLPNTNPGNEPEIRNDFLKGQYPDVYLSNQTPYSASNFSVTSDFKSTPTGHFAFTVTLKGDTNTAKSDFMNWLKSFGLTDTQIAELDITYQ